VSATLRHDERVTPLELFFDLVFVLALTQCTTLMADRTLRISPWEAVLEGVLVLGVLWWSWGGYAWLTSVVDPEEGAVRLVMFAAMGAFLAAALCVPEAFGAHALLFACAYAVVRTAHIALFMLGSRENAALRRSVLGLAGSTAIGVSRCSSQPSPAMVCSWDCGEWRSCSTSADRSCSALRAGSCALPTSPSATG
jgi:low temperature requirement protein LtrA